MTHTEDNCPLYPREMMPGVLESFVNLEALGKELNVKLHYFTMCGPDHVAFVLLVSKTTVSLAKRDRCNQRREKKLWTRN
jgi:hypothetical protein